MRTKEEIINSIDSKDNYDIALLEVLVDIRDCFVNGIMIRK